jgi:hypothetical protein
LLLQMKGDFRKAFEKTSPVDKLAASRAMCV